MESSSIGRHLLALQADSASLSPALTLVASLGTAIVLVVALAMCVCNKQKKGPVNDVPDEVTPDIDRKSNGDRKSMPNGIVDEVTVKTDVEAGNRLSNGSVVKDHSDSGRPKSHDQRALPDIPAVSNNSVSQTDEEEDEGHYDFIPRSRQARNNVPAVVIVQQNLYEKVKEDPMYAGVKDEVDSSPNTALLGRNPYAEVDGIGDADYAHIEDRKGRSPNRDLTRVQSMGLAPQASIETLEDSCNSYSSMSAPPVPDKHFDSDEALAAASVSPVSGNSPSLPPRNGTTVEVDGVPDDEPGIQTYQNGASIVNIVHDQVEAAIPTAVPKKKEPPYSSVTARESLANLRERQAKELGMFSLPPPQPTNRLSSGSGASGPDVMYESVNYDEIKSAVCAEAQAQPLPADQQSLASDLYAEIVSDSGENSTRSSMYVRVADIRRDTTAPTPPPVDFLRNIAAQGAEDAADPHYSTVVPRPRPQSDMYSSYGPSHAISDAGGADYAVIDKRRKNRVTLHMTGDASEIYAEVNKTRSNGGREQFSNNAMFTGTGARPKVPEDSNGGQSAEGSRNDPGYQTIGSVDSEDPDYDHIPESSSSNLGSEYDPNYDRIRENGASRQSPGVATEIGPDTTSHGLVNATAHRVDSSFWNRQEHVYQEITETQRQKMQLEAMSDQYADQMSTAL